MWRLLLVALAACAGSFDPDSCPPQLVSDTQTGAGTLTSGDSAIAVTWSRQFDLTRPEHHGALVFADGTVSADVAVDGFEARGVPGTRTALWLPDPRELKAFEITLARVDGSVMFLTLAEETHARAATFDGTRYQLFWSSEGGVFHQSLTEDGALGALHTLTNVPIDEVAPASGAGTTLVRLGNTADFIDTETGARTPVLSGTVTAEQTFFFAGKFHLHDGAELVSITSTGAVTRRPLGDQLISTERFYATSNKLVAQTAVGMLEVSSDLVVTGHLPSADLETQVGLLGTDFVQLRRVGLDFVDNDPGHVDVISVAWTVQLDVDSPVRERMCEDF